MVLLTRRNFLAAASILAGVNNNALSEQNDGEVDLGSRTSRADLLVDRIGVCVHLSYFRTPYGNFDELVRPRVLEVGIRHLRDGALIGGSYGPDHEYYRRMRSLASEGRTFSLVVPDENFPSASVPPAKLDDVYEWSGRAVDFFEGGNEVNLLHTSTWPEITRRCQHAMYETIKSNPKLRSVKVLGPALAGVGASPRMLGDISAYVDYANWHTYSGGRAPETPGGPGSLVEFLKEAQYVYPGRKMVITETGYHSALNIPAGKHPPTPVPIIARYLPRLLLWNFKQDIRRTYIYELVDTHVPSETDAEANFGLVSHDGTPKASFFAIKNLIKLFSDPGPAFQPQHFSFSIDGDSPDLHTLSFQKRSGTFLIAIWLGVSAWDSVARINLPTAGRLVRLEFPSPIPTLLCHHFEDDGGVTTEAVPSNKNIVSLSVTDRLSVLEFRLA